MKTKQTKYLLVSVAVISLLSCVVSCLTLVIEDAKARSVNRAELLVEQSKQEKLQELADFDQRLAKL